MSRLIITIFSIAFTFSSQANESWVTVGDMIVPRDAIVDSWIGVQAVKQVNIRLWPNGILRYRFSSNVSESRRRLFLNSCAEMGEFANIQCLPKRSQDNDYLLVQDTTDNVCGSSYLGRFGGGQPLKIRCWRSRTIQHELMHALGVSHEHNRVDRDDYIEMVWDNISPTLQSAFRKISLGQVSHMLSYYDYDSIMHYGSRSGSANGGLVFYRKDRGPQNGYITQSNVMSYGDHYFLYYLYGGERP